MAALAMLGAAGCSETDDALVAPETLDVAPMPGIERLFWSGHSLVDRPLPDQFAAIAQSLDRPLQWNTQIILGSSIKQRSRGDGSWDGYRQGMNRAGSDLDVATELQSPRTVTGGPYDAMIITEQHTLLGNLVWNDTIGHLRHFHDRAIAGNAAQTTYLYQSWLGIDDRDDPRRWIAYEKAAAPAWRCVAMRINGELAAEGRPDRIVPIDAGAALATFVEQAVAGQVPGFAGPPAAVIDLLFADDVHLTPLGNYFVALYLHTALTGAQPMGAWAPERVSPEQAQGMQATAWAINRARASAPQARSLEACRNYVSGPFMQQYLAYMRARQVIVDGKPRAWITWAKHRFAFTRAFGQQDAGNPLYFDPADRA